MASLEQQTLIPLPSEPLVNDSFDTVVIADGLPIVEAAKLSKFDTFLQKKFAQFEPESVRQPTDADGNGVGIAFITFKTPEAARQALSMTGKPIDKTHNFIIDLFDSFQLVEKVPDVQPEYDDEALIKDEFMPYLHDHLVDVEGRDQLLFRWQDKESQAHRLQVDWFDQLGEEFLTPAVSDEALYSSQGKTWTASRAGWSPKGTYMYTFHQPGLALWGGKQLGRIRSVKHPDVAEVQFSPCERWVATMSYQAHPSVLCDVAVFSVQTGEVIVHYNTLHRNQPWPFFKWSADGRFFGRVANNKTEENGKVVFVPKGIAVYDMEKREVVGGKPLPAPGLVDFQFSPTSSLLAYSVIGLAQMPSYFAVYDLVSRKQLLKTPAFGVELWNIFWNSTGTCVASYMDRKVDKRNMSHSLSVYDMTQKRIAAVTLNLPKPALHLAFSPKQNKISVSSLISEDRQRYKAEFSVYSFDKQEIQQIWSTSINCAPDLMKNVDPADPEHTVAAHFNARYQTSWSPSGDVFLLITHGLSTNIELYSVQGSVVQLLNGQIELSRATHIQWDPTGRYFILAQLRTNTGSNECRYHIYDFQGSLVYEGQKSSILSIEWRPIGLHHITAEQVEDVNKQLLSKYWPKYTMHGDQTKNRLRLLRSQLRDIVKEVQAAYQATQDARREAYGGWCTEDDEAEDNYVQVDQSANN